MLEAQASPVIFTTSKFADVDRVVAMEPSFDRY